MPFVKQAPRVFSRAEVEALAPNQRGVYGLFRDGLWVYVGKGDIRQRLLDHLNGDNPFITSARPTYWVGEVLQGDPSSREKQLIAELSPACNRKLG